MSFHPAADTDVRLTGAAAKAWLQAEQRIGLFPWSRFQGDVVVHHPASVILTRLYETLTPNWAVESLFLAVEAAAAAQARQAAFAAEPAALRRANQRRSVDGVDHDCDPGDLQCWC